VLRHAPVAASMMGRMKTPGIRASRVLVALAAALVLASPSRTQAADDDAIDGRWRGEVAFGSDRVEVAFDSAATNAASSSRTRTSRC